MTIGRTGNPTLSENTFLWLESTGEVMTLEWTIQKSFILIGILVVSAGFVWSRTDVFLPWYLPLAIVTLVLAIVIVYWKQSAPYLASMYAIIEGILIGTLSALFEQRYPGIVLHAVGATMGTFLALLAAYRSGWIQATENFKLGIAAATGGIAIVYLVSLVGSVSGWYHVPYIHESGLFGIGFSVFVVCFAALNLVLDFDFIESGVEANAPKYMEWYASFGLLVTLVWLYIEILRLLAKLRSR